MVKRGERSFWHDKGHMPAENQESDDDCNKPLEPYKCTGHFERDFTELCQRAAVEIIPPVIARPHRPAVKAPTVAHDTKPRSGKKKQTEPVTEPEPEKEIIENGEPPPKTYTTKEKFEYFKPCVQVELTHPEKQETVTELFIRGWRIDNTMMEIFHQCWAKMNKLHTISLWHTGLTDESIEQLAELLPHCPALKMLDLDNNPVKSENYFLLIKDDSRVQHLSLRYNRITDKGAKQLGWRLGTADHQNTRLVSLNLNGNQIGDSGACVLADGLRTNCTLVSLSLAQNLIGDAGAEKFAEVLSRFPISHEEVVKRRKTRQHSSVKLKRQDSRSDVAKQGLQKRDVCSKKGDASHSAKDRAQKRESASHAKKDSTQSSKSKTQKREQAKRGFASPNALTSRAYAINEAQNAHSDPEMSLREDGTVMLMGNRTLLSLNLAKNEIGEAGIKSLVLAVNFQTDNQCSYQDKAAQGLMRLILNKNKVSNDNDLLRQANIQMLRKDPFYTPRPTSSASTVRSTRRK